MTPKPTELRQRNEVSSVNYPCSRNTPEEPPSGKKCIGIDGKWYDITNYIPYHPGGPIIEQFIGRDATEVFHSYGHQDVLKHRRPCGTYTRVQHHPADADFVKLREFFQENGFFETDIMFNIKKALVCLSLITTVFVLVICFPQWYLHYLAGFLLAMFWQQCGFLMHDYMHSQVFRDRFKDRGVGMIFGTLSFGVSSHWWQDEHIIHHAMTTTVDYTSKFMDVQMVEAVWANNEKLFPMFTGAIDYMLVKLQHITFIPLVIFCGRIGILNASYQREKRWYEWVAIACHWLWISVLLSYLPSWREVAIFYGIAMMVEGVLHFQLVLSHYSKEYLTAEEYHGSSWYVHQVLCNINIKNPWWQDWFHGGLNFHIEHHLYPKIARNRLREAAKYTREICKKHNIEYDECTFSVAMWRTLVHLKKVGKIYVDPR